MKTSARILIIEDNQVNLELMTYLLNAFGYATLSARDGEEGLEVAIRELPDLILCDMQMPKLDGYGVAQQAKSNSGLHDIPLIAVTAFAMVGDRDKVLAAGFDGYLAKPIDPTSFVQQLEAFLPVELRAEARRARTGTTLPPAKSRPGGRTILVVDDTQAQLDLASSLFEHAGFTVVATRHAEQALALARQAPPDLIMSDVCMPDGSGYDLIAAFKADPQLRNIPFVFVTSTAMTDEARAKGLSLGAMRYLFRPLEPQNLLDAINACLPQRSGD
jgi:two-component system cell cycle response regulator